MKQITFTDEELDLIEQSLNTRYVYVADRFTKESWAQEYLLKMCDLQIKVWKERKKN